MPLAGKRIVLGITGSIAAYKACTLVRLLIKKGAEVQTVITPSGKEFITPLTLSTLTGKPVVSEFFDRRDGSWHSHVKLGLWADAMVIAPASASTLGKMATGVADNMLLTTYLSMKAPTLVAPAMDLDMYQHPTTQRNLAQLKADGVRIIEATSGPLASHLTGQGRMEEPERIIEVLEDFFTPKDLAGKRVLITAGPTQERIDPVRYISNDSSGKMGCALALECARRGAMVDFICGPMTASVCHPNIRPINVVSAQEMLNASVQAFPTANAAILCAAVADYTPTHTATQKIKHSDDSLTIELTPTADIAATLGNMKRQDQRLIGFALETNDELTHARNKMQRKHFDFIILNSLNDKGAGFRHDTNKITILNAKETLPFVIKPKAEVAHDIVDELAKIL